jgi:hypothetical protein
MSFHVEPAALRAAASKIGDAERVAELAGEYVTGTAPSASTRKG